LLAWLFTASFVKLRRAGRRYENDTPQTRCLTACGCLFCPSTEGSCILPRAKCLICCRFQRTVRRTMPMAGQAKRKACGANVRPGGIRRWLATVKSPMWGCQSENQAIFPLGSRVEAGTPAAKRALSVSALARAGNRRLSAGITGVQAGEDVNLREQCETVVGVSLPPSGRNAPRLPHR
jgi:hypothetical protein